MPSRAAGSWVVLGAVAGTGALFLLSCRQKKQQGPSGDSKLPGGGEAEAEALPNLLAPVRLPLRRISPHGAFGAPRYLVGRVSTAIPPYPGAPIHHRHQGIDLLTEPRESVYAVGRGRIVPVKDPGFGGQVVKLLLEDGRAVVYTHLSAVLVALGQWVGPLTEIGRASRRGTLHVAVRASENGPYLDASKLVPCMPL